jgi:uncharacterized protein (TIGR02246 family)
MQATSVEESVARLVAIEAIKQVKSRYLRAMDEKDWALMASVFSVDAIFGPFPPSKIVHHGRDAIVQFLSTSMATVVSVHQGHTPEITITSPTTATGVWAMTDYVQFGENDKGAVGLVGYGFYRERYVCVDEQWYIDELSLPRIRVDALPGGYGFNLAADTT